MSLGRDGSPTWGDGGHGHPWGSQQRRCVESWGTPRRCPWDPHHDALCHWDPHPGWWLGSHPPPGCWSTPSCCKQPGRKQPLRVGRGLVFFPLVLSFYFEAKRCWFGGEAAAGRGGGWMCPQPQATEESLGQGAMTPKRLRMMKCPDSFV